MEREVIEEAFSPHAVPDLLLGLCDFDEEVDALFSGDFELADSGKDQVDSWFQGDEELSKHFLCFGHDGQLSLYALWLKDKTSKPETAPVAFLDGDFEGTRVVAANLKDFLGLLALNVDGLGYVDDWDLGAASRSTKKGPKAYREWLEKTHGMQAPADPRAVVAQARAGHPDLKAWITQRMSAE
jgi:hypothetical protein